MTEHMVLLWMKFKFLNHQKSAKMFQKHGDFWWHFMIIHDAVKPICRSKPLGHSLSQHYPSPIHLHSVWINGGCPADTKHNIYVVFMLEGYVKMMLDFMLESLVFLT